MDETCSAFSASEISAFLPLFRKDFSPENFKAFPAPFIADIIPCLCREAQIAATTPTNTPPKNEEDLTQKTSLDMLKSTVVFALCNKLMRHKYRKAKVTRLLHKKVLLTAAACLILSSCGQPDSQPSQASQNQTAEETVTEGGQVPAAADENAATSAGNSQDPLTAEEAKNGDTPAAGEETAVKEPELLYHINKAYNVVPNDEGDEAANKKVVLLTFDDGPKEKEMIDGLIDTLDKHGAKAIFFVNGYRVKEHPELLRLIADRGQIIGNHSWDHIDLKKEKAEDMRKQIEDVQTIVKETTGEAPRFFRPPFGSGNDTTHRIADENGLIYMTWSNGSLDWDTKNKNKPEAVIANVLEQLHAGSNILMHELPWTVDALDELLTKLEEKGYGFVDPRSIGPAPANAAGEAK